MSDPFGLLSAEIGEVGVVDSDPIGCPVGLAVANEK